MHNPEYPRLHQMDNTRKNQGNVCYEFDSTIEILETTFQKPEDLRQARHSSETPVDRSDPRLESLCEVLLVTRPLESPGGTSLTRLYNLAMHRSFPPIKTQHWILVFLYLDGTGLQCEAGKDVGKHLCGSFRVISEDEFGEMEHDMVSRFMTFVTHLMRCLEHRLITQCFIAEPSGFQGEGELDGSPQTCVKAFAHSRTCLPSHVPAFPFAVDSRA